MARRILALTFGVLMGVAALATSSKSSHAALSTIIAGPNTIPLCPPNMPRCGLNKAK